MKAILQCLSHTPLVGYVDPEQNILDEVDSVIKSARERIAQFDPELVFLFSPDHFNGFFYNIMPSFCIGMACHAIGDFGSPSGPLNVPPDIAEACAASVLDDGVDIAVSYPMQVDHGFSQPLDLLLQGLDRYPVIPIFVNSVAPPMPSFQRARLLGEAVGRFARQTGKRVLLIGSGGLSHQPPVPELATASEHMQDRLKGSGYNLPPAERKLRTQRVIDAARLFLKDQNTLHPLNPEWDQYFLGLLEQARMAELDATKNADLSELCGKSTHEVKAWVAAAAAMSMFGRYQASARYYRPIPEWIAGFGALYAAPRT